MPLKLFTLKLEDIKIQPDNKRKVEHLLIKYSGIRISLKEAIDSINTVIVGDTAEVLFHSDKIAEIETAFLKHAILVQPKVNA